MALNQDHFRWRFDDAILTPQVNATWMAATDTNPSTVYPDTVYRLRISVTESGVADITTDTISLYYSKNGGSYTIVPTANGSTVRAVLGGLTHGSDTTQQITTGDFTGNNNGCAEGSASLSGGRVLQSETSEFEWTIAFPYDAVSDGDTFAFRVYLNGSPIGTYSQTPTIAITKPVYRRFEITDFRWRRDDGTETTATWVAPANTEIYSMVNSLKRLRMVVRENYNQVYFAPRRQGINITLESSKNGGSWTQVTETSENTKIGDANSLVLGNPTVQQLGTGTFNGTCGEFDNADQIASTVWLSSEGLFAGREWEVEVAIVFSGGDVNVGSYFEYRLTMDSAAGSAVGFGLSEIPRVNIGPWPLAGNIAAQASLSAAARLRQACVGAIAATSSLSGTIAARRKMSGAISATSSVSGAVGARRRISGAIAATSALSGSLNRKLAMSGAISQQSSLTGSTKLRMAMSGAIAAHSSVSASAKLKMAMSGSLQAAASLVGSLAVTAAMAGSIEASTTVSGSLGRVHPLQGSIAASSQVTGSLFRIGTTWPIEGHIASSTDVFADTLYQVPQWSLVDQFTGRGFGQGIGYSASNYLLAALWEPAADVRLDGFAVWLARQGAIPEGSTISAEIWVEGSSPAPWSAIAYSNQRRADKITEGTATTGGDEYNFSLIEPVLLEAGQRYYIVLIPGFGPDEEAFLWWQGDLSVNPRFESWVGDDTGEAWVETVGASQYIKLYAAEVQTHSLAGSISAESSLAGELLKRNTYYVRADGTASSKEQATSPNSAATSMSPTTWAGETFEPGDTIVWSAKGGDYEQVTVSNSSSGLPGHPIVMRGEFAGSSRPWISGGIKAPSGWAQYYDPIDEEFKPRWYVSLAASPKTRNVVADGVDLGQEAPTPSEVDQPGEWHHDQFEDRLYLGGSSAPTYAEVWVQKADGAIITVSGSHWDIEDLYLTLGYRSSLTDVSGLDVSGAAGIRLRGVGGIGHGSRAIGASGCSYFSADQLDFTACANGIDISDSNRYSNGPILQRSSFYDIWGTAVKIENQSFQSGQIISAVRARAFERCFTLQNMSDALIEKSLMETHTYGQADAFIGGVNVLGGVFSTTVRNNYIEGTLNSPFMAGLVIFDPNNDVQIAFTHNTVVNATYGAVYTFEFQGWMVEQTIHNNTLITTLGGCYFFGGTYQRISYWNNVHINQVTLLEQPQGGWMYDGAAEGEGSWITFRNNIYHDRTHPLIWYFKGLEVNFGTWCGYVGEYASSEQNPQLKNVSLGQYWPVAGPALGTGSNGHPENGWDVALVPAAEWPNIQANEQTYPWNRGAFLSEGSTGELELQGEIASHSSVSGNLKLIPHSLAGHVVAQSSLVGDLWKYDSTNLRLSGQIQARSTVAGDLFAPTKWSLAGHIATSAFVEGDLYAPDRFALAGSISASSSVSGLLEQNYLWSLAGQIAAQASLEGSLAQKAALAGAIEAQSSLSGSLTQVEAIWPLAGHISQQSDLAGDLKKINGLAGSINAQSSLYGDLTQIEASWGLEGHVQASSALSGVLGLTLKIAGAIAAQSALSGNLSQIEASWDLAGHVAAASSISGNLQVRQLLVIDDAAHDHTADPITILQDHQLDAHDADHAHFADELGLVQNIDLSVDDATHGHTAEQPTLLVVYALVIDDSTHQHQADNLDLNEIYTLTIGDSSHGHTADEITLGQAHVLTIADATSGHTSDEVMLSGVGYLGIYSATSAHSADNLALTQDHALVVDSASHGHTADPSDVAVIFHLAVDDASHGLTSDEVLLAQLHELAIDSATSGHSADQLELDVTQYLAINSAAHGQTSEELFLTENIDLAVDDSTHGHAADQVTMLVVYAIEIDSASHSHFSDSFDLDQVSTLDIDDSTHVQVADGLVLTEHIPLAVQFALHSHVADGLSLTGQQYLAVDDSAHAHSADAVALTQAHVLGVDDSWHQQNADNAQVAPPGVIGVLSATHAHHAENVALDQVHFLNVVDTFHQHHADGVAIESNQFLVIRDARHLHWVDVVALAHHHKLTISDASHAHSADSCNASQSPVLVIAETRHLHWAFVVNLTHNHILAIADALHSQSSDEATLTVHELLVVEDASHGHTADQLLLVEYDTLKISEASHGHTADNVAVEVTHLLSIDDALHQHSAENVTIATEGTLGIQSARSNHSADSLELGQTSTLVIADADHAHAAGDPVLTAHHILVVDETSHGHQADSPNVTRGSVLVISNALHFQFAESPNVVQIDFVDIADATSGHLADNLVLAAHAFLAVDDAAHSLSSEEPQLAVVSYLEISDTVHQHESDALDLGGTHLLAVDECLHAVESDGVTLAENVDLGIDPALHGHAADEITLLQVHALVVEDALHGHEADPVDLQHNHILAIDDASHGHSADELVLVHNIDLSIDDAIHQVSSDEITIIDIDLVIDSATHAMSSDDVPIVVGFYLEIDDSTHAHSAEEIQLVQHHVVAIADAAHTHAADGPVLDTPWYQTQRATARLDRGCIEAVRDDSCINVRVYPSEEGCS